MLFLIGLNLNIVKMIDKLEDNKFIQVYDDVFNFDYRQELYCFIKSSLFKIGWADSIVAEKSYEYLHSIYNDKDIDNIKYFKKLKNTPIMEYTKGLEHKHTVVNLSTLSDANFVHSHPQKLTILYYANLDWQDGWHGETIFYDDFGKEVIFTSPYTPGRIIVFDGRIPHTIRPQSSIAPKFRFTISSFFDHPNEDKNEH